MCALAFTCFLHILGREIQAKKMDIGICSWSGVCHWEILQEERVSEEICHILQRGHLLGGCQWVYRDADL